MLALRKAEAAKGLIMGDIEPPEPEADEVLVAVEAAGICGSDLHVDDWVESYHFIASALPVTLGHEFSGRVIAHGPDGVEAALPVGTRVIVMPSVTCGACADCLKGRYERCTTRRGIGMTRNGAFASHVTAPARNCIPIPAGLEPAVAALTEPLTVAWQAVARGGVAAGMRVLVLGPGTIGQGIALMAQRAGASLVAVAGHDDAPRLRTVESLGIEHLFDLADPSAAQQLSSLAGSGFDAVLEATGAAAAVELGLGLLRPDGVFVAVGIHEAPAQLDVTQLVRRQIDIRGSYRAPLAAWPRVIAALAEDPNAFAPMITRRMALFDGLNAFAFAHSRAESKIVLMPQD